MKSLYRVIFVGRKTLQLRRIRMQYLRSSLLRKPSPFSPINSRSATIDSMASFPQSLINRLTRSIRSCLFEFPLLFSILRIRGKATPLYTTPSISILISVWPNSQLVRSILKISFSCLGKSAKIRRAIILESKL